MSDYNYEKIAHDIEIAQHISEDIVYNVCASSIKEYIEGAIELKKRIDEHSSDAYKVSAQFLPIASEALLEKILHISNCLNIYTAYLEALTHTLTTNINAEDAVDHLKQEHTHHIEKFKALISTTHGFDDSSKIACKAIDQIIEKCTIEDQKPFKTIQHELKKKQQKIEDYYRSILKYSK